MSSKVYIVCGGTGGHLAPGIATAQRLMEQDVDVVLLVSEKQIDSQLLQGYPDIPFLRIRSAPFSLNPVRMVRFLVKNFASFVGGIRRLRRERPSVILAFGGFVSVSYTVAAWFLHIPVVLHEANRVAGRSIRFLSGMADTIFLPDGVGIPGVEPRRLRRLDMPLRREVSHISKEAIRRRMDIPPHAKVLTVVGGSQGAQILNEWVVAHYKSLAADGIWVLLVTGPGKAVLPELEVLESDQGARVELRTFSFHQRLHELFSVADVVLSRAGAGTIAELVACLTPSILVPYPSAADDHQFANARNLECRGGAILLCQSEVDTLYREVLDLAYNDWLLGRMRSNLRSLNHGDAADHLAAFLKKRFCEHRPEENGADPSLPPPQPRTTGHG